MGIKEQENSKKSGRPRIKRWHVVSVLLIIYDILAFHIAYFFALWSRFDFIYSAIPAEHLAAYMRSITLSSVAAVIIFWGFNLYRNIWRYASVPELEKSLMGSFISAFFHCLLITALGGRMPFTYYIWGSILLVSFVLVSRFAFRILSYIRAPRAKADTPPARVMLIGAGSAGQMVLRDLRRASETNEKVVCVIDDNPNKWGRYLENVLIVGGRDTILENAGRYRVEKIYLAIPSATPEQKRDILAICSETDCELKQLPGMYQFVLDQITVSKMKKVSVEDLLGREPIKADLDKVFAFVNGKTVLVTGGGGSIGSELCRQVAGHSPKRLIIFDIYENNAYAIQLELKDRYPNLDLVVLIGSVRDSRRIFKVFADYRPDIVYHAAAHKHVPLMEDSPCEAIKNNAIGTYKTAYAAMVHGCSRFVLISTDKAVNPTNIMGASKRLCEMIIQAFDAKIKAGQASRIPQLFTHVGVENADKDGTGRAFRDIRTEFVAVRFGNVLGSNGSVIPIFKSQIERGGPVTVTHPDIIRYFMTIPEAVSLVLLAGSEAKGGEIFVLDMGDPVKIETLARNLIRLSGFKPDVDIKIEYTGLRPGEKLFEEKLMAEEGLEKTENDRIHIGKPVKFDIETFLGQLQSLMDAAYANKDDMVSRVEAVVSTYHPA